MIEFYDKNLFQPHIFRAAVKELEQLEKVEVIPRSGETVIVLIAKLEKGKELTDGEKEILQSEPKSGNIPKDTTAKLETK